MRASSKADAGEGYLNSLFVALQYPFFPHLPHIYASRTPGVNPGIFRAQQENLCRIIDPEHEHDQRAGRDRNLPDIESYFLCASASRRGPETATAGTR